MDSAANPCRALAPQSILSHICRLYSFIIFQLSLYFATVMKLRPCAEAYAGPTNVEPTVSAASCELSHGTSTNEATSKKLMPKNFNYSRRRSSHALSASPSLYVHTRSSIASSHSVPHERRLSVLFLGMYLFVLDDDQAPPHVSPPMLRKLNLPLTLPFLGG